MLADSFELSVLDSLIDARLELSQPKLLGLKIQQDPFHPIANLYSNDLWQGQLELTGNLVLGSQRSAKVRLFSIFELDRYQRLLLGESDKQ